jgi:cell wall-active antibiotic response 4TMS protein YvqF
MSNGIRCHCARCTIGGMMGPVVLITLGVLFLLGRMHFGYGFRDLWPVLLIVIGLVKVASAMASTDGHTGP